jgi:hypothetical protein
VGREILLGNSWTKLVKDVVGATKPLVDEVLVANTTLVVAGAISRAKVSVLWASNLFGVGEVS